MSKILVQNQVQKFKNIQCNNRILIFPLKLCKSVGSVSQFPLGVSCPILKTTQARKEAQALPMTSLFGLTPPPPLYSLCIYVTECFGFFFFFTEVQFLREHFYGMIQDLGIISMP